MARSNLAIQGQLLEKLEQLDNKAVTAPRDSQLRAAVGLDKYSNNAVQRAMGSLIKSGKVVRQRLSMMDAPRDSERPVTWCVKNSYR